MARQLARALRDRLYLKERSDGDDFVFTADLYVFTEAQLHELINEVRETRIPRW